MILFVIATLSLLNMKIGYKILVCLLPLVFLDVIWNNKNFGRHERKSVTFCSHIRRQGKYIISSSLSFGRLSNLKMSLAEVIGLSLALNRTAIIPSFDICDPKVSVDQLFSVSDFSRASIISTSSLDLEQVCGEDVVMVLVSNNVGNEVHSIKNEVLVSNITLQEPYLFGDDLSLNHIFTTYPYDRFFLPKVTEQWANLYMKDRLLPDKLATLNMYRCIFIGTNFLSLNWARLPAEFEEVHKELLPILSIRSDALNFLRRYGLSDTTTDCLSTSTLPFIAIHLRMGDFLSSESHQSFGIECNNNPDLLVFHVKKVMLRFQRTPTIVMATDDYHSTCALHIQDVLSVINLDRVSLYKTSSCQGALFDQEVLGASSFFIGDKKSTFSQAIHQIRTLRYKHDIETTIWL